MGTAEHRPPMSLNLSKLIADALQGRAPAVREFTDNGSPPTPPEEFLERDVWPLVLQARLALEDKGFLATTVTPAETDESRTHALLFMDWSAGVENQDAGCLRFMLQEGVLHASVKQPGGDSKTLALEPAGNIIPVIRVIEEFLYHCLAPIGRRRNPTLRKPVALKRSA